MPCSSPAARIPAAAALAAALAACAPDGAPPGATAEDYRRAEGMLRPNAERLVTGRVLARYWQEDGRLVYRARTPEGLDYVLADPAAGSRAPLFDRERLAAALAPFADEAPDPNELTLSDIELEAGTARFDYGDGRYALSLADYAAQRQAPAPEDEFLSPDGRRAAFIRDHNLWVRDTLSGELTQLTFDGREDYGYATNNAGWLRDDGPVLLWSPDSAGIATFRHDGRGVGEMYLYSTRVGHPELDAWKYPLPGDERIFMIERLVIHLEPEPRIVRLDMPPDPHRSSVSDHVAGRDGTFLDVEWSADGARLAFVSTSRDHKTATLRVADARTGAVRDVFSETADTYYESGAETPNWRVFHERGEFVWFSEKDNWGHLYLHDLESGALKNRITAGDFAVLEILKTDPDAGRLWFLGSNREPGDPYHRYLYRVDLDGGGLELLTPEPANHAIEWSVSGEHFFDEYSTPTEPPAAVIRDRDGALVQTLERADLGALRAAGWRPPEPFTVKARDMRTDLHGLLYLPSGFDGRRSLPVLNYIYPGPQAGSVGSRSFRAARRDKQALAELGFAVVELDAMGTPGRSKAFHDAWYGDMGDNGLPDQIAAIRQLGATRPWMDLDRVGVWGHSGGGFAAAGAVLRYPDFYKVAVASAGNHDNRNYEDAWGEKWHGPLAIYPETGPAGAGPRTSYDSQANQLLAGALRGKLLLAHGLMDDNVHPSGTLLLVQALIEAEKDFDLLLLPDAGHGFGDSRYFMKRRWDYFVRHLQGAEPPADFRFADNID